MPVMLDLSDTLRPDYPQPSCPVCGRFAKRSFYGSWEFSCVRLTDSGWEHAAR